MVLVTSGKNIHGKLCEFYLDGRLKRTLDVAIDRVKKKNWDYVALVAGIPGAGKSTFVRGPAKYCCPWFSPKYVAFSGEEFIRITNECPEYSSVVLDESFQSLNTRVAMTPDFLRIINHLQIVRQKHLYIFLCLPNFFDLSKGVAVFRSSHLFITYATDDGSRGKFMAFDRNGKRKLYVKGGRYMDYNVHPSNFKGRFSLYKDIIDEKEYDKIKLKHLHDQQKVIAGAKFDKTKTFKKNLVLRKIKDGWIAKKIETELGIPETSVYEYIKELKEEGIIPNKPLRYLKNDLKSLKTPISE